MKPPLRTEAERIAGTLVWEDVDLLANLQDGEWLRPMDLGGHDGSDHCGRLQKLIRKGLVERRRRSSIANDVLSRRGSYVYRRLPLGLAVREVLLSQEQTDER